MTEAQALGFVVSLVTLLVSLWTRLTVAELRLLIEEKFATKHQVEKIEERVLELEREPVK